MKREISGLLAILLASAIVFCVLPTIKAQPALPAMWVTPATLNFSTPGTSVGTKFNVTVWAGSTGDVFTYQAEVLFNTSQIEAVRAGYTNVAGSLWWKGHTTVATGPNIDNSTNPGTVVGGETLLGSDVVHASNGSLFWVEFQITTAPTPGTTLTSIIDTNDPNNAYILDPDLNTITINYGSATYTFTGGAPPPTRHDAAITGLTLNNTTPKQNDTISIDVTALNNGTVTETFDVNVTIDGKILGTQTTNALSAGATQNLIFTWNTTGATAGTHTITATAILATDQDPSNNVKTATARVLSSTIITDVNGDGRTDMKDIGIVARQFGMGSTDPGFNPLYDINHDGVINLFDLAIMAQAFRLY